MCEFRNICPVKDCFEMSNCQMAITFRHQKYQEEKEHQKQLLKNLIIEIQDDARISPDYVARVNYYVMRILEIVKED